MSGFTTAALSERGYNPPQNGADPERTWRRSQVHANFSQ
jgi:hypothetical protein